MPACIPVLDQIWAIVGVPLDAEPYLLKCGDHLEVAPVCVAAGLDYLETQEHIQEN